MRIHLQQAQSTSVLLLLQMYSTSSTVQSQTELVCFFFLILGSCDRAQCKQGRERETKNIQWTDALLSIVYLNMFRALLCPSLGEQDCVLPHMVFSTGCAGRGSANIKCIILFKYHRTQRSNKVSLSLKLNYCMCPPSLVPPSSDRFRN